MKHAGRLWRGASRQGRVKRRRRTEASVGARDEEPGPFGTCTAVLLLGRGQRAVIRLPAPVAPNLGSMRAARGAGGRPEHDHPRSGKAWGPTAAERRRAPRGVTELRRQKTSHRTGCLVTQGRSPRASPAPHPRVRNRTGSPPARWTGPRSRKPREHRPRDGRDLGPARTVSTRRSALIHVPGGRTTVLRCTAARQPFIREWSPSGSPNRPLRQPTRRLSGSGRGCAPTGCPAAGEPPSGGRLDGRGVLDRTPAHGTGSGK